MSTEIFKVKNAHNQMIRVYEAGCYGDVTYVITVNEVPYAKAYSEKEACEWTRSLMDRFVDTSGY